MNLSVLAACIAFAVPPVPVSVTTFDANSVELSQQSGQLRYLESKGRDGIIVELDVDSIFRNGFDPTGPFGTGAKP